MIWLTDAKYIKDYMIKTHFNDGTEKIVDLKNKVVNDQRAIFRALQDLKHFAQARLNPESDTIEWPNGADIAPEFLYQYPDSANANLN